MASHQNEKNPGCLNSRTLSRASARELKFQGISYSGAKNSSDSQLNSHPGRKQSNQSTGQPSWLHLNQTSKLDSHPGCHSIKPVNWTAILAVTQSNQSVNPGGRQADLKGGLEGGSPPASYLLSYMLLFLIASSYFFDVIFLI